MNSHITVWKIFCSAHHWKAPFDYQLPSRGEMSRRKKMIAIVSSILAGVVTLGIGALPTFYSLTAYFKQRKLNKLAAAELPSINSAVSSIIGPKGGEVESIENGSSRAVQSPLLPNGSKLINFGNSCWFNTALKMIASGGLFDEQLLRIDLEEHLKSKELKESYQQFISIIEKDGYEAVDKGKLREYLDAMKAIHLDDLLQSQYPELCVNVLSSDLINVPSSAPIKDRLDSSEIARLVRFLKDVNGRFDCRIANLNGIRKGLGDLIAKIRRGEEAIDPAELYDLLTKVDEMYRSSSTQEWRQLNVLEGQLDPVEFIKNLCNSFMADSIAPYAFDMVTLIDSPRFGRLNNPKVTSEPHLLLTMPQSRAEEVKFLSDIEPKNINISKMITESAEIDYCGVGCIKRNFITKTPDDLLVHLNRIGVGENGSKEKSLHKFDYNFEPFEGDLTRGYLTISIDEYDENTIRLNSDATQLAIGPKARVTYRLAGAALHQGNAEGGHWVFYDCPDDGGVIYHSDQCIDLQSLNRTVDQLQQASFLRLKLLRKESPQKN